MAPPRDEGTEADPAPPAAFATGSAQDRDELRAADLRSAPRPSILAASVQTLKGAGPKLAAAAADMGLRLCRRRPPPRPALLPGPGDAAKARRAADRRGGDGRGDRPLGESAAHPPAGVGDRGGVRSRRLRAGEGGLVQPGVARRSADRGRAPVPVRQARPLRLPGRGPRGAWRRWERARRGNPHHGDRSRPPGIRGAARAAASGVGVAGPPTGPQRDRAASGGAARPAWPCPGRRRADRGPVPGEPRGGGGGPASPRVRGALPASGGARGAPLRAAGEPPWDRADGPGRGGGEVAWLAAVRTDRRPASCAGRDRLRSRCRAAHAAAAHGRGRLRQDRRRRSTRCSAPSRRATRRR